MQVGDRVLVRPRELDATVWREAVIVALFVQAPGKRVNRHAVAVEGATLNPALRRLAVRPEDIRPL
jgi:hypothetical protein